MSAPASRAAAVLMLLAAALLWSSGGLLIKWIDWQPMAISGMRSAIAVPVLWLLVRRKRFTFSLPQVGGAIAYALCVTLFVLANKMTTAANTVLLQYTAPAHVAIFGIWYLGEKPRRLDWITLVLVFAGMILFFLEDIDFTGLAGNLTALGSGVAFAWMALFLRKQRGSSLLETVILGNLLAALIGLPFMVGQPLPDAQSWLGLILLGVFQVAAAYYLFTRAIQHVTALESLLIPTIEPVLNPIWVFLLLGETPGFLPLIGGTIIVAAVLFRGLAPLLLQRRLTSPPPSA